MGRRAKATRENVISAIKKLIIRDGSKASISASSVRKVVGGGSLSTITGLLNQLRLDHPEIFAVPAKTEIGDFSTIDEYIADLKVRLDVISNHLRATTENPFQDNHRSQPEIERQLLESKIEKLEKTVREKNTEIIELHKKIKTLEDSIVKSLVSSERDIGIPDGSSSHEDHETSATSESLSQDNHKKLEGTNSENKDDLKLVGQVPTSKQKTLKPKPDKDKRDHSQLSFF